ncbi:hypothetical protein [Rhizobium sp. OAE497]|uniref:hypothetical protein n=1 Tax=Rhizobium sp. OAE497 TaxID=2663796 RepID=UPI0018F2A26D
MTIIPDQEPVTPEMQFLLGSYAYVRSAQVLRFSEEWETEAPALLRPTLNLLSHGLELLLKVSLLHAGLTPEQVASTYRHNLRRLWDHDENRLLRELLLLQAEVCWLHNAKSGRWPKDNFNQDPRRVFVAAVYKLSRLHSGESNYALRYLVNREEKAPRSAFLIDTLYELLFKAVRQPALLYPAKSVEYAVYNSP